MIVGLIYTAEIGLMSPFTLEVISAQLLGIKLAKRGLRKLTHQEINNNLKLGNKKSLPHSPELINTKPLHLNDFIVAGPVIEWIASLREIVHNICWIQHWNPRTVVP